MIRAGNGGMCKMRMRFFLLLVLLSWLPLTLQAGPSFAPDLPRAARLLASNDMHGNNLDPGLAAAVAEARRRTGGKVLSAERRGEQYRIKVLTPDGRVRILHVGVR
jgi:hypothetical protein